jgi:hypothetical protein
VKTILGVCCFALAIVPAGLAVLVFDSADWFRLSELQVYSVGSVMVLCALAVGGIGTFLVMRRRSVVPGRVQGWLGTGVFGSLLLSVGLFLYMRAHAMSGAERILVDLRQIEAATGETSGTNGMSGGPGRTGSSAGQP